MNTTRVVRSSTDELGLVTEALASPTRTTRSYSSILCQLILDYLEQARNTIAPTWERILKSVMAPYEVISRESVILAGLHVVRTLMSSS